MIELKYKDINNGHFQKGVGKLMECEAFGPKEAYNIAKIADKVGQETRKARELYGKIIRKYAKKDDKGAPVMASKPPYFEFAEGVDTAAFDKEYEEFLDISVQIPRHQMVVDSLPEELKITPIEMVALEPIWKVETIAEPGDNVVPMRKDEGCD